MDSDLIFYFSRFFFVVLIKFNISEKICKFFFLYAKKLICLSKNPILNAWRVVWKCFLNIKLRYLKICIIGEKFNYMQKTSLQIEWKGRNTEKSPHNSIEKRVLLEQLIYHLPIYVISLHILKPGKTKCEENC